MHHCQLTFLKQMENNNQLANKQSQCAFFFSHTCFQLFIYLFCLACPTVIKIKRRTQSSWTGFKYIQTFLWLLITVKNIIANFFNTVQIYPAILLHYTNNILKHLQGELIAVLLLDPLWKQMNWVELVGRKLLHYRHPFDSIRTYGAHTHYNLPQASSPFLVQMVAEKDQFIHNFWLFLQDKELRSLQLYKIRWDMFPTLRGPDFLNEHTNWSVPITHCVHS